MTTSRNPNCQTCGHAFNAHTTVGFCPCEVDVGGQPCSCHGFTHVRGGRVCSIADAPRPSRKERHRLGLETVAASEAMHQHDWHRLNAILFGSDFPAHQHAIAAFAQLAFAASVWPGGPEAFYAMMRERVTGDYGP